MIATARNLNKLSETRKVGIEEIELDVLSQPSISACAAKFDAITGGRLDILINNAGAGLNSAVVDLELDRLRRIFELNTFSQIPVTRAFLPALMKSKNAKVANNISCAAYAGLPFQGAYNASKAAASAFTENMRIELAPFGIKVIGLMTGGVQSKFFDNVVDSGSNQPLPEDSIYRVVPGGIKMLENPKELFTSRNFMDADVWAAQIVKDLSRTSPSYQIYRGSDASLVRLGNHLPIGTFDNLMISMTKLDEVYAAVKKA